MERSEMSIWDQRSRKRLEGEHKALARKARQATQNGVSISGRDVARLRRVEGQIEKVSAYGTEYEGDFDDWDDD
jgi:hypothetical protein